MVDIEKIITKLRVGALEDITVEELETLVQYIDNLREISDRYDKLWDGDGD